MHTIKRRISLLLTAAMLFTGLVTIPAPAAAAGTEPLAPMSDTYTPESVAQLDLGVFNLNYDWRYHQPAVPQGPYAAAREHVKQGGLEFYDVAYDDSAWSTVSLPHSFNAKDSFRTPIGPYGDLGVYQGIVFYRKHFNIPAEYDGKKVFVEFEGARQAAYVYLNGQLVGYYEAGIVAFGFDLSEYAVKYGDGAENENVLAVAIDNRGADLHGKGFYRPANNELKETVYGGVPGDNSGLDYQWNPMIFNPMQGGLNKNVRLHVKDDIFLTLPLYANLRTEGTYIYPSNVNVAGKSATIHVEAEVRNESAGAEAVTVDVVLVDKGGAVAGSFSSAPQAVARATDIANNKAVNMTTVPADAYTAPTPKTRIDLVDTTVVTASATVTNLNLWSLDDPYLYDVYTILKDSEGNVLGASKTTTGFRKVDYRGTSNPLGGGVYVNDAYVWLTGYAQRATSEWAAIGVAPDWLNDFDMRLVKESNANHIRWMHIAPMPSLVRSTDKYGIAITCPAGDHEADATGRKWAQRVEIMRNSLIYFRNNPSVFFWEIGNANVTVAHMQEMMEIKNELDPHGFRAMGCRDITAATIAGSGAEYGGTMTATGTADQILRARSVPVMESEYGRGESPRRVWDDYSPPNYDFVHKYGGRYNLDDARGNGADGLWNVWDMTAEDFALYTAKEYNAFRSKRAYDGTTKIYSGAAILCWMDDTQYGRMSQSETSRMSGRVDPARVLKPNYYDYQTMQSDAPMLHIVGHWNYPDPLEEGAYEYEVRYDPASPTVGNRPYYTGEYAKRDYEKKTVYVVASYNIAEVELYVNGVLKGQTKTKTNGFIFSFPNIDVSESGKIEAVGYNSNHVEITRSEIVTVGDPVGIKLTPVTGPKGLIADGNDIAYFDIEVVDAEGRLYPLSYDRIDFTVEGPAEAMGGYNSGLAHLVADPEVPGKYDFEPGYNSDHFYAESGTNRLFIKAGRTAGEITVTVTLQGGLYSTQVKLNSVALEGYEGGLTRVAPQTLGPDEGSPVYTPYNVVESLQPLIPAATPFAGAAGTAFTVAPFAFAEGDTKLESITVTKNIAYDSDVNFITGVFDTATGALLDAHLKTVADAAGLNVGVPTGVTLDYTPAGGFDPASRTTKLFTWTGLSCPDISAAQNNVDFNPVTNTGSVSLSLFKGSSAIGTSLVVLKPGADPENISIADVAYLAQGVTAGGTAEFDFALPAGSTAGEYTVLIGSASTKPVIAGKFTVLGAGEVKVAAQKITSPVLSGHEANVKATVAVADYDGEAITLSLLGKTTTFAVQGNTGTAYLRLTAAEVPLVKDDARHYAYVYVDGAYTGVRFPVTVAPEDSAIWTPFLTKTGDNEAEITFTGDITSREADLTVELLRGDTVAPVSGFTWVNNVLTIDETPLQDDVFLVSGIRYENEFPSYRFTHSVPYEAYLYYDDLAFGKKVRVSSEQNTNFKEYAVNGDRYTSRWTASGSTYPQWVEIDLGEVCLLDRTDIYWFDVNNRLYYYKLWYKSTPIADWDAAKPANRDFAAEGYMLAADRSTAELRGMGDTKDDMDGVQGRYVVVQIIDHNLRPSNANAALHSIEVAGRKLNARRKVLTITATAGENGTITPSGEIIVEEGGWASFTFKPANGFVIDTVLVDGQPVTVEGAVYLFEDISASHTIHVTFRHLPNVALNKPVTPYAGHAYSGTGVPAKAVDGDITDDGRWIPNNTVAPKTLEIDLQGTYLLYAATIYNGHTTNTTYYVPDFKLQYWYEGEWVDIPGAAVTGNNQYQVDFIFTRPVMASKVRFYCPLTATIRIHEIMVYGQGVDEYTIDFDDMAVGEVTGTDFADKGYNVQYSLGGSGLGNTIAAANGKAEIVDAGEGNHYFKLTSVASRDPWVHFNFPEKTDGIVTVSYRVYFSLNGTNPNVGVQGAKLGAPATNVIAQQVIVHPAPTAPPVYVKHRPRLTEAAADGGTLTDIELLVQGWYDIQVVIDIAANQYDLWVNGRRVGEGGASFYTRNRAESLRFIYLSSGANTASEIYIDDISILVER